MRTISHFISGQSVTRPCAVISPVRDPSTGRVQARLQHDLRARNGLSGRDEIRSPVLSLVTVPDQASAAPALPSSLTNFLQRTSPSSAPPASEDEWHSPRTTIALRHRRFHDGCDCFG
jgi:hypothetical protein